MVLILFLSSPEGEGGCERMSEPPVWGHFSETGVPQSAIAPLRAASRAGDASLI
jgi:hypothetical protein